MLHEQYRESVHACQDCATACRKLFETETSDPGGDVSGSTERRQYERACVDICRLTAEWLGQDLHVAPLLCDVCAVVCSACADELAKQEGVAFVTCADACRRCAEACRRLVGGAVPQSATSIGLD